MFPFQTVLSFILLAASAMAQPISTEDDHENTWKYGTASGIIGFIVLILDILASREVIKSDRRVLPKCLWCLLDFIFPIGGLIIYYFFSHREEHKPTGGYETLPQ
ncbi:hypothetical protein DL95DRAFT_334815 [Leptodontidium sp. 2 PMI_412]|nr:hypothetical protein BKA61DRAFT_141732 [Leptodontidium sp. MPI-SDFR-AT-0119]KAH9216724.1 hypothetical protein DL95DRAFT_334815 [Leptodontidium sp. 2 PMI_412]